MADLDLPNLGWTLLTCAVYIILIEYVAPLDEIDAALPAHAAWLDENYDAGHFLVSGRREPRTGGVILVDGQSSREAVEAIVAADPFAVAGLATHLVVAFHPSRTASGFGRR